MKTLSRLTLNKQTLISLDSAEKIKGGTLTPATTTVTTIIVAVTVSYAMSECICASQNCNTKGCPN